MDRNSIIQSWSDAFKDAYGFRPRGYMDELNAMTDAELTEAWEDLCSAVERSINEEHAAQQKAKAEWEARIAKMMEDFEIDKGRALRWDAEANDFDARYGWSQYCWSQGLPYSMAAELEELLPAALLVPDQYQGPVPGDEDWSSARWV